MFEALHAAVTLAKNEQIRTVTALRSRLDSMGFAKEDIDGALQAWANYAVSTR